MSAVDRVQQSVEYADRCGLKEVSVLVADLKELMLAAPKRTGRRYDYSEEFDKAWDIYPRKTDVNKLKAFKAWGARLKAGISPNEMIAGTERYAQHHKLKGTEQKFILLPATFYGPDEHFKTAWSVPDKNERIRQIMTDGWHRTPSGIEEKAKELGISPRPGEYHDDLKKRIMKRLNAAE
jgi:hypothetical protein